MIILEWFLTTKLGRLIGIAGLCVLAYFGFTAWLAVHDASIRHAALAGYVQQAKLDAAEAENTEIKRQLAAGRKALNQYADLLAAEQEKNRAADAAEEQRIKDNEAKLAAEGRARLLDQSDVDWLLKP